MKPAGSYDVIIIGGGIAGASLASFLADHGIGDVLILERESQLAVHSTGRSAASISAFDGNDVVLDLKILGSRFWRNPPTGLFADAPLNPLGVLSLFAAEGFAALEERETELRARGLEFDLLSAAACREKMPVLEAAGLAGGLFIGHDGRLDVHGILQGYLRHARAAGAELVLGAEVSGILREGPRVPGPDASARWPRPAPSNFNRNDEHSSPFRVRQTPTSATGRWSGATPMMSISCPRQVS
jgi:D-arginine dehydrogenase